LNIPAPDTVPGQHEKPDGRGVSKSLRTPILIASYKVSKKVIAGGAKESPAFSLPDKTGLPRRAAPHNGQRL